MTARAAASEATEQRIRAAAGQLFGELPYDQVSLQTVAERAEVTVQTVLRRFSSKDDLFAAASEWMTSHIRDERDDAGRRHGRFVARGQQARHVCSASGRGGRGGLRNPAPRRLLGVRTEEQL